MIPNHTPKPWKVEVVQSCSGLEETGYAHQVVKGGGHYTVANTRCRNYEEYRGDGKHVVGVNALPHDKKPHPDALLMSAAPELLEACKEVLCVVESCLTVSDLPTSCVEAIRNARLAISKAEGKQ